MKTGSQSFFKNNEISYIINTKMHHSVIEALTIEYDL